MGGPWMEAWQDQGAAALPPPPPPPSAPPARTTRPCLVFEAVACDRKVHHHRLGRHLRPVVGVGQPGLQVQAEAGVPGDVDVAQAHVRHARACVRHARQEGFQGGGYVLGQGLHQQGDASLYALDELSRVQDVRDSCWEPPLACDPTAHHTPPALSLAVSRKRSSVC